ncbi:hypothetical protein EDD11_003004 [Mortierella claussenii]|nr:hypothetical protein EDD11_003004 [Mortierella claussenii]
MSQDHVHPVSIQSSGCTVSPAYGSVGMVDQPRLLLTDGSEVGTTQGGLVCVATEPPPATLHVVETMQESDSLGRTAAALETPGTRLLLPPVEPPPSSTTKDSPGESGGDGHHPILAVGTLVSNNTDNVDYSAHLGSEGLSEASAKKRTGHFGEKCDVVAYCMEHKRQALMRMGADDSLSPSHKRALTQRAGPQLQYIRWALARDIDPLTPKAASLPNFLVSGVTLGKLSEAITTTYKSQIIQLYKDQSVFQTELFRSSIWMLQSRTIGDFKALDLDLTPEHIFRLPSEEDLVPHLKDPTVLIRSLMRDRRSVAKAVGT